MAAPEAAFAALHIANSASGPAPAVAADKDPFSLNAASTSELLTSLYTYRSQSKPLVKSTVHTVTDPVSGAAHSIVSWKMNEFAYRKEDKLPSLARGLFTVKELEGGKRERILVRGYDKFFNVGEMPWTKPESIKAASVGPYEITFKENGCIIFIGALTPSYLVVTSKHSLGHLEGHEYSHAQKGEEWLDKHLASAGKTKAQLAAWLFQNNMTAVAELCDDLFEEHVLPYPPERSGLYLHGLNYNTASFKTRPMSEVEAFAKEWGFIPTRYVVKDTLAEVDQFTSMVGTTGTYKGEPIEGFVVRTRMPVDKNAASTADGITGRGNATAPSTVRMPPYAPGQPWFYKVKFDEPYLMYREWRELARKMYTTWRKSGEPDDKWRALDDDDVVLPGVSAQEKETKGKKKGTAVLETTGQASLPRPHSRRPESFLFVRWAHDAMRDHPELFEGFEKGHGIIRVRDAFLRYLESEKGKKRLGKEEKTREEQKDTRPFTKTCIVPVAVPGCGKTILSVALVHLFGFGHTQSDNIQAKKTAPHFLKNIQDGLKTHDVLIADRNNHLSKHRAEIAEAVAKLPERVRLVALNWSLDSCPLNTVHRICADRITRRGGNHQSLRVDESKQHETILWRFLSDVNPFDRNGGEGDDLYDDEIIMAVDGTPEGNLRVAIERLAPILDLREVTDEEISAAISKAMEYKPSVFKKAQESAVKPPRYYALAVELDVQKLLTVVFAQDPSLDGSFFESLVDQDRVTKRPHVTLVHEKESEKGIKERWDKYAALWARPGPGEEVRFALKELVWDDQVMAIAVGDFEPAETLDLDPNAVTHITVGTANASVRPYESNLLLQRIRKGKTEGVKRVSLGDRRVSSRLKGFFQ